VTNAYSGGSLLGRKTIVECIRFEADLSTIRHARVAIGTYASLCFVIAVSGSFGLLVIIVSSSTLLLYMVCCLGLLRLRAPNSVMTGEPFHGPGGPYVPLAADAIMIWILTTVEWKELAQAARLIILSGGVYAILERKLRAA
jgi:APA family basic amino acid/polyamine antiporter